MQKCKKNKLRNCKNPQKIQESRGVDATTCVRKDMQAPSTTTCTLLPTTGTLLWNHAQLARTPYTTHLTAHTLHHTPYSTHLTPHTLQHAPYSTHLTGRTLQHTPYSTHLTAHTLQHTPDSTHLVVDGACMSLRTQVVASTPRDSWIF